MKSIIVGKSTLYDKIAEIFRSDMDYVEVSICDEELDQNFFSPPFIHFDAYKEDGSCEDFDSIDSIQMVPDQKWVLNFKTRYLSLSAHDEKCNDYDYKPDQHIIVFSEHSDDLPTLSA